MNQHDALSTWELFLNEISRNIRPSKKSIEESLSFLIKNNACSQKRFEAICSLRYMAAYEQAINEYLHPPDDFKQANIKAELIHFGSLFEGLSEVLLVRLHAKDEITLEDYNLWFTKNKAREFVVKNEQLSKKQKKGRVQALSFKGVLDCLLQWNKHKNNADEEFADFIRAINMLRNERNSVHVNKMVSTNIIHEEYKLVEVREKWLQFVRIIEETI
jgi:hypothetical protein